MSECELCAESEIAIIANSDRYGIPLQAGMCLRCGLVLLLDRLAVEGYAEFYKSYYRPLVSQFFGRPINGETIQREQSLYASQLVASLKPWLQDDEALSGDLLDIGGSTGTVALEFVNTFGYEATVLDPAPDELQFVRGKGLKVVDGFFERYDPGEQKFDLVLMCQTIDHLHALRDSLNQVHEIVKPDGYFYCDIVDFDEMCYLTGCVEGALHLDHCYYLTLETALWMFRSHGWNIVQVDVAMRPGHVGYLLKPVSFGSARDPVNPLPRIRQLQHLQTRWQLASQHTYGIVHWARKRAYRAKQYLKKLRG